MLLSDHPIWVFADGQFLFGMPTAPTREDDALIRAACPGQRVVYLRASAPILLKIPDGHRAAVVKDDHLYPSRQPLELD